MLPLKASKVLAVEGVEGDALARARMGRLMEGIECADVRTVVRAARPFQHRLRFQRTRRWLHGGVAL